MLGLRITVSGYMRGIGDFLDRSAMHLHRRIKADDGFGENFSIPFGSGSSRVVELGSTARHYVFEAGNGISRI